MNILIAGANGKTGKILVDLLAQNGHTVKAMIRKEEQSEKMKELGAVPVLADLEKDTNHAFKDIDAVIFAAGSGSKTGPEKTIDVDRNGAIRLIDTAKKNDVNHFVMLSSMGADHPEQGVKEMQPYFQAKHDADEHLLSSGLAFTIVRPGFLTDGEPTGEIIAQTKLENNKGEITRGDVAKVLVESLMLESTKNKTFEILNGNVPIEEALNHL
ncbi:SDR family oxidoreductase [Bacillus sp. CECT 9360]|uniref:SDR family oxidoreductase n=1 Tax=Bacillus sp. CECT 9360 TaxID=2845821 RepID=UPI001E551987|nr:SDR family oxidoreductase [Bacillus sp. CECT 9360]CAH0344633.1 putative sugar epimerase YhfK [Bacillus sp. CECT 9360]